MMNFDPTKYQRFPNGPLVPELVQRLVAIKEKSGMSYSALGEKVGFSGTFLHNLINKGANVNTQHIERIVHAVELLENPDSIALVSKEEGGMLQHSFHLRPDLQIKVELPSDLSEREADRLARFIQSLPVS